MLRAVANLPRWFPDGQRVAFICGEPRTICTRSADGSGETERIGVDIGAAQTFDIAPDGSVLIYDTDGRGTRTDLWIHDFAEGSDSAFLDTPDFESEPRFSADGRLLAHVAWELGMEEVFLREYPGKAGKWQVSTEGGTAPIWAGNEIFWLESVQLRSRIVRVDPEVSLGPPESLFRNGVFRWGYDVSRDGRRIVAGVTPGGEEETALVVVQNRFAEFAGR